MFVNIHKTGEGKKKIKIYFLDLAQVQRVWSSGRLGQQRAASAECAAVTYGQLAVRASWKKKLANGCIEQDQVQLGG